jgi:hypothetical protein
MMGKYLLFFSLFIISFTHAKAQVSTPSVVLLNPHSPNKAANLSAMLPGLGQVYNKQYLKVPVFYAGAAGLIYGIRWNNIQYKKYLNAYRLDTDTSANTQSEFTGLYSVANLIVLKDFYRRNRDLSAIVLSLWYAANIVDAYVYAQFYNFDVSDNLSLNVKPYIYQPVFTAQSGALATGLTLTLRIK